MEIYMLKPLLDAEHAGSMCWLIRSSFLLTDVTCRYPCAPVLAVCEYGVGTDKCTLGGPLVIVSVRE